MDLHETVRELLRQARGEALCNACLAFACSTSLIAMWQVTGSLLNEAGEFVGVTGTCASCQRVTSTFAAAAPPKCAHCSRQITDSAAGITVGDDEFHRSCWHLLLADERVRVSRSLSRQSRELIARARLQLNRARIDDASPATKAPELH